MASSDLIPYVDESTPLLRKPKAESTEVRWAARNTLALFGFLGMMIEYCQRVTLSVDIVSMVRPSNSSNSSSSSSICPTPHHNNSHIIESTGEFNWDKAVQGTVLSSFFYGYACTNLLGGRVSEYIGGKRVYGLGILTSSLLSLICPISAQAHVGIFIACRVLMGMAQGVTFPAINIMLATWILPKDRSKFSTIVYSGFQIGTVIGLMLTGWLCNLKFLNGWPLPFYFFGILGVMWSILWYFFIYERPEDHPRISATELRQLINGASSIKVAGVITVPWKSMLTSLPFWAIIFCGIGNDFGFYTLLTELPTYLHDVQNYDIASNGLMSSIPYFLMWIVSLSWAVLMSFLTHKNKLAIVTVRRLSMAVALYGPMIGLIAMCFVNCNAILAVAILCLFGMLNGAVNSGYMCSHQDIAPNLAGTLFGISNTLGAICGISAPSITSAITRDGGTLSEWRTVFLISVGIYLVCCTLYIILISAEIQPWNEPQPGKDNIAGEDVPDGNFQHKPAHVLEF